MAQRDAALLEPTVLLAFSAVKAQTIGTISAAEKNSSLLLGHYIW